MLFPEDYEEENRRIERCYWRRVGFWAFAALLLIGLAMVTKEAAAAEKLSTIDSHDRPLSLTLSNDPCKPSVLKWKDRVKEEYRSLLRAAILHYGGRDWDSCWVDLNGMVYSIDEEGVPLQGGRGIPRRMFRENTI